MQVFKNIRTSWVLASLLCSVLVTAHPCQKPIVRKEWYDILQPKIGAVRD
jgi:hypothetical protein